MTYETETTVANINKTNFHTFFLFWLLLLLRPVVYTFGYTFLMQCLSKMNKIPFKQRFPLVFQTNCSVVKNSYELMMHSNGWDYFILPLIVEKLVFINNMNGTRAIIQNFCKLCKKRY